MADQTVLLAEALVLVHLHSPHVLEISWGREHEFKWNQFKSLTLHPLKRQHKATATRKYLHAKAYSVSQMQKNKL